MKINLPLVFGAVGVGLAGAAIFWKRKDISMISSQILDAGQNVMFAWSLPTNAQQYGDIILEVAKGKGLDPFLLAAIGQRESLWGGALRPPGPAGTGDWTPRTWTPYPMPPDGQGWGRGLMQLDYWWYKDQFAAGLDWADPYQNIEAGAQRLVDALNYFKATPNTPGVNLSADAASRRGVAPGSYPDPRPLAGDLLNRAAIAAYNTGISNALMSVAAGVDPDTTTAGSQYGNHDYGSAVLASAASLFQTFSQSMS